MTALPIHPTAIIDPTAELGVDVLIGPYCIVGPNCKVGDGSVLTSHVVLEENVTLGAGCEVSSFAALGGKPQDLGFKGETSYVEIGDGTHIRESVTVHRASGEGNVTRVGKKCLLMATAHVAHNDVIGDEVILANGVILAGYVTVGDYSFISGQNVVHQHVQIGSHVIMSGSSGTRQDIPHYAMCAGRPAEIRGINKVGLRRRGFSAEQRKNVQRAYDLLWFSGLQMAEAMETVQVELGHDEHVVRLLDFVKHSKRGIRRVTLNDRSRNEDRNSGESSQESVEAGAL